MPKPTQSEILDRIAERKEGDIFGFEWHEYVSRLTFEKAKPFLKDDADPQDWKAAPSDRESVLREAEDYLGFAFEKANNCRGISANRSVMHYIAWTWLAGDREFSDLLSRAMDEAYQFYGKPLLVMVAEKYGWDWRSLDDDNWTNYELEDGPSADRAFARWRAEHGHMFEAAQ